MYNKNILISVVMPVYNAEDYLSESINSILNQTYSNFEFIIINDGSTDKSLEIIKKYKIIDNRVVLISRENKGVAYSSNEGAIRAKGKYIIRMDADDISLPTRFEEQVKFMEAHNDIGVCGTWVKVFGNSVKSKIWKLAINSEELKTRLLFSVPVANPSVIMRKGIIIKYKLKYKEENKYVEDYEFWVDFFKYTKFANIPKILLKYRYLEDSMSRTSEGDLGDIRYKITKNIFTKVLRELNINNTESENRLHFTISLNERIAKEKIDLKTLNRYLDKIVKANNKTKIFNEKYLKEFLAKKFLVCSYFSFRQMRFQILNIFRSKLFYVGIINYVKSKLN